MDDAIATAHVDTFARDHLPPRELWPVFDCSTLPELSYPDRLNCARRASRQAAPARERGDRGRDPLARRVRWTYAEARCARNRIAHVLVEDLGLVPGNRVLLRAPNCPMLAACWFAVLKAGGIAVGTMPLLRARELTDIVDKARDLARAVRRPPRRRVDAARTRRAVRARARVVLVQLRRCADGTRCADARQAGDVRELRHRRRRRRAHRLHVGHDRRKPKGTMHFHRDCSRPATACRRYVLARVRRRRVHRQPAARVHVRARRTAAVPDALWRVDAAARAGRRPNVAAAGNREVSGRRAASRRRPRIARWRAARASTICRRLRKCVSAGEALPAATRDAVERGDRHRDHRRDRRDRDAAHLHLARRAHARPGATGKPCARLSRGGDRRRRQRRCPPGTVGRLAVKGPTGCRYLDRRPAAPVCAARVEPHRRRVLVDADGYYRLPGAHRRHDHLGRLQHRRAGGRERAAAASRRRRVRRGRRAGRGARTDRQGVRRAEAGLRAWSRRRSRSCRTSSSPTIAPYKYPRAIEFVAALPRTETGKLQRFRLRQMEAERAAARR